ncbi:unnamed protein product [Moneuplotes crassus]|uniref:Uncharacterized protein n=1 Tax=Euplotes crassus TaxID=5936 RepID=A0AAD1Y5W4_EUPCR|nr:unnamed protein product [Moneuplotes crassus]
MTTTESTKLIPLREVICMMNGALKFLKEELQKPKTRGCFGTTETMQAEEDLSKRPKEKRNIKGRVLRVQNFIYTVREKYLALKYYKKWRAFVVKKQRIRENKFYIQE